MTSSVPSIGDLRIEPGLPTLISPREPGSLSLDSAAGVLRDAIGACLERTGAVHLTGFGPPSVDGFEYFAASFGAPLVDYSFASTPRSRVHGAVYTSTEYPSHRAIPLHNEQSYTREWPLRIWFHCVTAARAGGETPIADSRAILRALDPALVERFARRELLYVRNFGQGVDLPWQRAFGTDDRASVQRVCDQRGIECEWREDTDGQWLLRTRERCQAVAVHPHTGELVWFNQAHLFHLSALDVPVQEALIETVGVENVPRNVFYGDGAPLESDALAQIRAVLDEKLIVFPWAEGDVLMLDNMLCAHARTPFAGPRKVVVAMARNHRASEAEHAAAAHAVRALASPISAAASVGAGA
ncbi:TauD/TfdA family dioxygenase [Trinickia diaoshuihuensis]|uniref:TauD/TfdA family dioxygenase n=1 Tax=Trinickia diaoshuihuensis TaxID=2292265 RepID=UPI000E21FE45|nr:TauD/TfdA family dioxygenase [Trinickia diaoshuihuensis]